MGLSENIDSIIDGSALANPFQNLVDSNNETLAKLDSLPSEIEFNDIDPGEQPDWNTLKATVNTLIGTLETKVTAIRDTLIQESSDKHEFYETGLPVALSAADLKNKVLEAEGLELQEFNEEWQVPEMAANCLTSLELDCINNVNSVCSQFIVIVNFAPGIYTLAELTTLKGLLNDGETLVDSVQADIDSRIADDAAAFSYCMSYVKAFSKASLIEKNTALTDHMFTGI